MAKTTCLQPSCDAPDPLLTSRTIDAPGAQHHRVSTGGNEVANDLLACRLGPSVRADRVESRRLIHRAGHWTVYCHAAHVHDPAQADITSGFAQVVRDGEHCCPTSKHAVDRVRDAVKYVSERGGIRRIADPGFHADGIKCVARPPHAGNRMHIAARRGGPNYCRSDKTTRADD